MSNYKKRIIEEIWDELWSGCGEQLELVEPQHWNKYITLALMNMLAKEKEITEYYKKRIDHENTEYRTGIRGMVIPS